MDSTTVLRNERPILDAEELLIEKSDDYDRPITLHSKEWNRVLQQYESELSTIDESKFHSKTVTGICDIIEMIYSICVTAILNESDRACAVIQNESIDNFIENEGDENIVIHNKQVEKEIPPITTRMIAEPNWMNDRVKKMKRNNNDEQSSNDSNNDNAYIALFRVIRMQRNNGRRQFAENIKNLISSFRRACYQLTISACEAFEAAVAEHKRICKSVRSTYDETLDHADNFLSSPKKKSEVIEKKDIFSNRSDRTARRMAARWKQKEESNLGVRKQTEARNDIFRAYILRSRQSRLHRAAEDACKNDIQKTVNDVTNKLRALRANANSQCHLLIEKFSHEDDQWNKDSRRLATQCARIGDPTAFHETVKAFCAEETHQGDACEVEVACALHEVEENRRFQKAWSRATSEW